MIELRKVIKSYLKTIHPKVYFQAAPDDAPYPYIVYDFPNINSDGEIQEITVVDIDGWDRPSTGDTTNLENLMSLINGDGDLMAPTGLNKGVLSDDQIAVSFYLDTKLPLVDTDPMIKRRKYVYQARQFYKG
ncbi:hypothetical protein J1P26_22640 [Neobacillus sp. MM2021_6]|uniref:hypothetical protein n=1 Tax=Bacillaceae TaxID=186817 RepID=UPI00140D9B82|nr:MULTISPECIES: hypothetical protein [Bacillaceae]MBO0962496.1 hypothetical protein [Neobacillus sp. MM2021_6]NHC21285.1 hypothetical protein [Bacillus sp. MM2020_4]